MATHDSRTNAMRNIITPANPFSPLATPPLPLPPPPQTIAGRNTINSASPLTPPPHSSILVTHPPALTSTFEWTLRLPMDGYAPHPAVVAAVTAAAAGAGAGAEAAAAAGAGVGPAARAVAAATSVDS